MTTTMQRTPTESMRASAQAHLELKDDPQYRWHWYRRDGVRYVAITSANSGKIHRVRADGQGCDCEAYLVWEYTACSHMLAVRESLNRDAVAAWADDLERQQRPTSANHAGVLGYLDAVRAGADHEDARDAGQRARLRYEDLYTED